MGLSGGGGGGAALPVSYLKLTQVGLTLLGDGTETNIDWAGATVDDVSGTDLAVGDPTLLVVATTPGLYAVALSVQCNPSVPAGFLTATIVSSGAVYASRITIGPIPDTVYSGLGGFFDVFRATPAGAFFVAQVSQSSGQTVTDAFATLMIHRIG